MWNCILLLYISQGWHISKWSLISSIFFKRSSYFFYKYLLLLFLKKGRLPRAAPPLAVSGVLEAWLPYVLLQMHPESLCGGSSRYTTDQRPVLSSSWEGRRLQPSAQLQEGHTWIGEGGRGHLPSQPDQPYQPWQSMGWQMWQPDHPHIHPSFLRVSVSLTVECRGWIWLVVSPRL